MKFLTFQQALAPLPVFSLEDIHKIAPTLTSVQLSRWQTQGYIQKLMNGFYRFPTPLARDEDFWYIANRLYPPSYVSGQTVLSRAGLIPENIDVVVSITSRITRFLETPVGRLRYHHVAPHLMFGYHVEMRGSVPVRVADTEKALLDFLYLNPHLKTAAAFEELRINPESWREEIHDEKLTTYLQLFNSKSLTERVHLLQSIIYA